MESRLKLVLFIRYFGLCMLPQVVLIAFIIIIYHVDYFCTAFNMVLAVCQYLSNITLISTVLLFLDLPRTGQDPCLGCCNVHKMASTYPICMNRVSPDSLWCQESYTLMYNVLYAQNDYFLSFLVTFGHFWLLCQKSWPGYNYSVQNITRVKYEHSSTKLWHSCTCRIKRISERYHLSRLSCFWWSYGDAMVMLWWCYGDAMVMLWWCNGCVRWGIEWSFWHWSIEMNKDLKNNACSMQRI
jgi:hypothetical protein